MDYEKYLEVAFSYLKYNSDIPCCYPTYADLQEIPDELSNLFEVCTGASKVVLVPLTKEYEYVIKIPLKGVLDSNYKSKYCNNYSNCSIARKQQNCPNCSECAGFNFISEPYEYTESYFNNACRSLGSYVENYFDNDRLDWDYCLTESIIYQLAQEKKVEEFFISTFYIGEYNEMPIYLQKKVDLVGATETSRPSKKSMELAQKLISPIHVTLFTGHLIDYYGEEKVMKLVKFFKEVPVNDLHNGNIGFINSIPVIFDYSGYHD